ncbi:MAG: hypothetical protein II149_01955 [Clostridia bacterium]|nr:hypothetical protein [Clostridia bacterium]
MKKMKKILTFILTLCICLSAASTAFAESEIEMPELADPAITVKQTAVPVIIAGQSGTVDFTLENSSFSFASDITVTIASASPDIKIDPADSIIKLGAISIYGKTDVSVPVTTSPSALGQQSLSVTVTCNARKDLFTQQSYTFSGSVSFVVERGSTVLQPVIKDMKFDSAEYHAGDMPVLSFTVENPNRFSLIDVTATLSGFIDGAVDPVDPDQTFRINELGAGKSHTFTVKMKTAEKTAAQIYNFSIALSASDEFGEKYSASKSAYFTVEEIPEKQPDAFTDQSPRVIVDSYKMNPTKAKPGDKITLKINLLNLGVLNAENVKISIGGYEAEYITLREITPQKTIDRIECQKTEAVEYSMTLSSVFPQGQNVPITVSLSYGDLTGKNYVDTAIINIISPLPEQKDPEKEPEHTYEPPVYKTPKVIIDSFETDTDLITAGTEFGLTFTLKNTSEDLDVENLRITLMDNSTSSPVFTPVNSGYSFFMDKVEKLGTHTLSIPLFAKVSAESGIYSLNFQIEYEYYVQDTEKTGHYDHNNLTETISLKVVQPINIEVSNFYCDQSAFTNGQTYISFNYTNKSRSNLYFMNIDIEGNAELVDGKMELGSIPSGYSDSVDCTLILGPEAGLQDYAIVFNFKDSLNQETTIRYPFTMDIYERTFEEPDYSEGEIFDPGEMEPVEENSGNIFEQYPWLLYVIIGGGVVIAAVIIVIIVVAVRKKKAKAAEDEDI